MQAIVRASDPLEKGTNDMTRERLRILALVTFGAIAGAVGYAAFDLGARPLSAQDPKQKPVAPSLAAEIETIKGRLPDQAHAMVDVNYHFANLWFAGKKEHWELAHFYWSETRSHLRWAVRIIPVRKDNAGQPVELEKILQAVENSPLKQLEDAIKAKDGQAFEKAYRFTLEGCYSCHKASDKPFLRPQIPTQPETHIINFDPRADWPK
jgi:hypothetical protein